VTGEVGSGIRGLELWNKGDTSVRECSEEG
jgi:hypothetical protein